MLKLQSLTSEVRSLMIEEIDTDIQNGTLYFSERLTMNGRAAYPALLREAAEIHDDSWLESQINGRGLLKSHEERHKPKGGTTMAKVPYTAAQTLAEGEFNRFYLRGLCRFALGSGIPQLQIYRAKAVENARSESQARIGSMISADALLADLRANPSVDTALRLPPGPNSGLSARLLSV
jgi:hypothetical protein